MTDQNQKLLGAVYHTQSLKIGSTNIAEGEQAPVIDHPTQYAHGNTWCKLLTHSTRQTDRHEAQSYKAHLYNQHKIQRCSTLGLQFNCWGSLLNHHLMYLFRKHLNTNIRISLLPASRRQKLIKIVEGPSQACRQSTVSANMVQ